VGNNAGPLDEYAYLPVDFIGYFSKVFCEFMGDEFSMYPPSVNPFKRTEIAGLETRQISVECWYVYPPIPVYDIVS
jgi:hypothetical protein